MGSQIGLFVVSSLGAKHAAFHSEDETQKVGVTSCLQAVAGLHHVL